MYESHLKPPVNFPTLTNSIVTFNSQYAGLPLKAHEVAVDYTGSAISGVNVYSCGKNLIPSDITYTDNYYLKSDGTIPYSNAWKLSNYIAIPKVSYLSVNYDGFPTSGTNVVYGFFDKSQNFISGISVLEHTLEVPPNAYYMRLSVRKTATDVQLEIGSDYTDYEQYNGQSFNITFSTPIYGGSYDCLTGIVTSDKDSGGGDVSPTYQQTATANVETSLGQNNVFADTGDTTLQYIKLG